MSSQAETINNLYNCEYSTADQREALQSGDVPVAVYGLGKMGLPLAAVFADVTGNVIGADVDPAVVETINDGDCHVKREPGLDELVSECVSEDALQATDDPAAAAKEAQIHVIIVPTPITDNNEPDLSILDAVVSDIGNGLDAGDQVIVECTVPPRTTEDKVRPQLADASGLDDDEFGVAFCPERTSSGRALEDIRGAYPKVVGGADAESTRVAELIYEEINESGVIPVSDATTAECVKVFEGLYRDVNIGLANELATITDEFGIDVREAIDVANTQPFCDIHDPGPGVGGHCIPFYPYFVIDPFETETPMLETAREVNDSMPSFTVGKLREELSADGTPLDESKILILGVAYRADVAELRNSPAKDIINHLTDNGSDVFVVDPLINGFGDLQVTQLSLPEIYDEKFDAVAIVTAHSDFEGIEWNQVEPTEHQLIVIDGRQTLNPDEIPHRVYTIGSGYHV